MNKWNPFFLRSAILVVFFVVVVPSVGLSMWSYTQTRPAVLSPVSEIISDSYTGKITALQVSDAYVMAHYVDGSTKYASINSTFNIIPILSDMHTKGLIAPQVSYTSTNFTHALLMWLGRTLVGSLIVSFTFIILILSIQVPALSSTSSTAAFPFRYASGTDVMATFENSTVKGWGANQLLKTPQVRFNDIGGYSDAKSALKEVVEFLKFPNKFAVLGARLPRGILLVGPTGTGKTLLAQAIAGEAGVPFFYVSGAEFVELLVGVGAARVRDLMNHAKRAGPCIVFIDDIEVFAQSKKAATISSSLIEQQQTLTQLLVEMEDNSNEWVVIVAATNSLDGLDPSLLGSGRFERIILLDLPDETDRVAIFKVYTTGKPLDTDVSLEQLARMTTSFSGTDINMLVNESAMLAQRRNKKKIGMREFEDTLAQVAATFILRRDGRGQPEQEIGRK